MAKNGEFEVGLVCVIGREKVVALNLPKLALVVAQEVKRDAFVEIVETDPDCLSFDFDIEKAGSSEYLIAECRNKHACRILEEGIRGLDYALELWNEEVNKEAEGGVNQDEKDVVETPEDFSDSEWFILAKEFNGTEGDCDKAGNQRVQVYATRLHGTFARVDLCEDAFPDDLDCGDLTGFVLFDEFSGLQRLHGPFDQLIRFACANHQLPNSQAAALALELLKNLFIYCFRSHLRHC